MIKHKQGKVNAMVDALSRRHTLLATLETNMHAFEYIKEFYVHDGNFSKMYVACENMAHGGFFRQDGYLFRGKCLCVPKSSLCELLIKETHKGELMGHFRVQKTLDMLHEHFYWLSINHDAHKLCERCIVCKRVKPKVMPHGLYTPLGMSCL